MKVLVCGDRNWTNKSKIREELEALHNVNLIIHGAARGADTLAGKAAKELNILVIEYPAEWSKYGKAAGIIRNRVMLDDNPDLILAFHSHIRLSKGTADTVTEARRRGIPTRIII